MSCEVTIDWCGFGFGLAGPGTVMCDNIGFLFMFLSIATSNMVATSLARRVSSISH